MVNAGDITEHKSAEEQIRFQARLLDAVGQAIIATDPQGTIVYWNRAAQELYGWSKEEVMGRTIVDVTPSQEMLERAEEIMTELRAGRSWSGEFVVQRKDGSTFSAMVTDTPVHDEQGNLEGIIGVSTDITEIKKMEELRRSELRVLNPSTIRSYKKAIQNVATTILPNAQDIPIETRSHAEATICDTCWPSLVSMTTCERLSEKRYAAERASSVYN